MTEHYLHFCISCVQAFGKKRSSGRTSKIGSDSEKLCGVFRKISFFIPENFHFAIKYFFNQIFIVEQIG